MHWYLDVLKNYATFSGRARRKEYWMFTLFNAIVLVALLAIGFAALGENGVYLYLVYVVAVLVPTLAVTVRRLHDTGRTGWWYFISFVPLVGPIVLLVFLCTAGNPAPNQYGADPKLVAAA
ncbi:DUF805 domain-containing protein [Streptomyces sp. DSM 42041]|uniref:DUF805 domain-containing protein n=1 Tax=Streptomyces hazeniae TaxID=3075538 RepID=A0ABU2NNQ5_9ACTN|nr:DUF805 domain-containing protein [Streptomyces sp. DSM 42041]MDT0378598.1 DUF805 domain-containing protein [Streptomyces sp. DSM 42041]